MEILSGCASFKPMILQLWQPSAAVAHTCWLGAWQMPDYSLMITFKEVTGPAQGRPRAKVEWQEAFGLMKVDPARDFTGLLMADMYLRSTNGGSNWSVVAAAAYAGPSIG